MCGVITGTGTLTPLPVVVRVRADGRWAVVPAPDVLAPEVLAPDVLALELLPPAAELLVRSDVFRGAVFSLVSSPASAIPAHPPTHVPERVVRFGSGCFRQRVTPSLTSQIQT